MVSAWGSEYKGWWEHAMPLKTSAQMRQMAHLVMAHLGKSRGPHPQSEERLSTGKTGKGEKEMGNCEQMIQYPCLMRQMLI